MNPDPPERLLAALLGDEAWAHTCAATQAEARRLLRRRRGWRAIRPVLSALALSFALALALTPLRRATLPPARLTETRATPGAPELRLSSVLPPPAPVSDRLTLCAFDVAALSPFPALSREPFTFDL